MTDVEHRTRRTSSPARRRLENGVHHGEAGNPDVRRRFREEPGWQPAGQWRGRRTRDDPDWQPAGQWEGRKYLEYR